jgi:hypothetical protein
MESLTNLYDPSQGNFTRREALIALWKVCPFDLHFFSARRGHTMDDYVRKLMDKLADTAEKKIELPNPEQFMQLVHAGTLETGLFEKLGAAMALQ